MAACGRLSLAERWCNVGGNRYVRILLAAILFSGLLHSEAFADSDIVITQTAGEQGPYSEPVDDPITAHFTATIQGLRASDYEGAVTWTFTATCTPMGVTGGAWTAPDPLPTAMVQNRGTSCDADVTIMPSNWGAWTIMLTASASWTKGNNGGSATAKPGDYGSADAYVVSVDHIEYEGGDGVFRAIPGGGVAVPLNQPVTLKAVPAPEEAPWPGGVPTWTFQGAGAGTGGQVNVTPAAVSATPTDAQTAEATCGGDVADAAVFCYDLSWTTTAGWEFPGRSEAQYGVGETIKTVVGKLPAGFDLAGQVGILGTTVGPGIGNLTTSNDDGTATIWAGLTAGTMNATVSTTNVAAVPGNWTFSRAVVAPSSITATIDHQVGAEGGLPIGVEMFLARYLGPTNVSFDQCHVRETDVKPTTATGNLGDLLGLYHGSGTAVPLTNPIITAAHVPAGTLLGSPLDGLDDAGFGTDGAAPGDCVYDIPENYHTWNSLTHTYGPWAEIGGATFAQHMWDDAAGEAQVTKFGASAHNP